MAAAIQLSIQASPQSMHRRSTLSSAFLGNSLRRIETSACIVGARKKFSHTKVVCSENENEEAQSQTDRWRGLATDISDDQQDISRGKGMVDSAFQGPQGGGTQEAIMSSLDYINTAQRTYSMDNMKDGFYIAPAFMDKLIVHISKNFMALPNVKVPLILGIWGGKGQGKSFQCELVFSKLGINPIMMSAGELESGNAGEPAKLIRQRYREAADIIKKKGQMCVLFINDLDAGAGRMGGTTQYTVNNQMVNATLMNIADNPTNVQLPGVYIKEELPRVPIIVTGNDFSTLYAPLIRDGRMEKFYWAPTREDRIGVCKGIFRADNVHADDIVKLVDTFPGQSIDFFGALRARIYDDEVRKWIGSVGVENIGSKLVNSREGPPKFEKPPMTVEKLLEYGYMLVQEQENVKRVQLAGKYMSDAALGDANEDAIEQGVFYGKGAQQVTVPVREGCSDQNALNFDPTARSDDGTCEYDFPDEAAKLEQNFAGKAAQQINLPVPEGCTDANALNFDPTARSDDGSCVYDFSESEKAKQDNFYGKAAQQINLPVREGCTDPNAVNYDPTSRSDDGTCVYDFSQADKAEPFYGKAAQQVSIPVPAGCTDPNAANFDPTARSDDGTCEYDFSADTAKAGTIKQEDNFYGKAAQQVNLPVREGCSDPNAINFDPTARSDDGSCEYDFSADTAKAEAIKQDSFYGKAAQQVNLPVREGCSDPNAVNFDPTARSDDGSCEYDFSDDTAKAEALKQDNFYGKAAQQVNLPVREGCSDPNAVNFDPSARSDDGSCEYDFTAKAEALKQDNFYGKAAQQVNLPVQEGCADPNAVNFDPTARSDDGSCEYDFSDDTAKAEALKQDNFYGKGAQQVNLPVQEGCADPNAVNYDPTARSDDGSCEYDFSNDPAKAEAVKQDNFYGKAAQQVNLPVQEGCADPNAVNFDPTARSDDGTCVYEFSETPTKKQEDNFYGKAAQQVTLPVPEGCVDPTAVNFDPTARSDDGSCVYDSVEKSTDGDATGASETAATKKLAGSEKIPSTNYEAKLQGEERSLAEKVLRAVLTIILLPFAGRDVCNQIIDGVSGKNLIGKRRLALRTVWTFAFSGCLPGLALAEDCTSDEQCPNVTQKVYFDITIDGEPAGRIVIGLYGENAPVGAKRFGEIAAGQKGISYRKRDFYKITKDYIQNGGVRTFSLSGRAKDTAQFTGGLTAEELVQELKTLDDGGKRLKNVRGSVSLVAIDATKPPPKPKLIARDGGFEVVYEESRPDPNGTEFCIAHEDAPELDDTNLVVGRVVEGFDVVEKIASSRAVKDNTTNLYFQTAKLIGDTRAVVAERGFNRPYSKIIISKCGTIND